LFDEAEEAEGAKRVDWVVWVEEEEEFCCDAEVAEVEDEEECEVRGGVERSISDSIPPGPPVPVPPPPEVAE
jgi:hypothetical protein